MFQIIDRAIFISSNCHWYYLLIKAAGHHHTFTKILFWEEDDVPPYHSDVKNFLSVHFPTRCCRGKVQNTHSYHPLRLLLWGTLRNTAVLEMRNWNYLWHQSTTNSIRTMTPCCTSLSAMHLCWWWQFWTLETLREATQLWINIHSLFLLIYICLKKHAYISLDFCIAPTICNFHRPLPHVTKNKK